MEEPSNNKELSIKKDKNNKKKSCQWSEDSIKLLLSFLIEQKEKVNQLSTKWDGCGNTKAKLWQDVLAMFLNNNYQYTAK